MSKLTNALPNPADDECIRCYLVRVGDAFSCDGTLRAVSLFRERTAPNDSDLVSKVKNAGIFWDCEFRMNNARVVDDAQRAPQGHLICSATTHPESVAGCANWAECGS